MNINKGLCITEKLVRKNPQLFLYEPLGASEKKPPHGQAHFTLFVPLKIKRACPSPPPPKLNDDFYTHIVSMF